MNTPSGSAARPEVHFEPLNPAPDEVRPETLTLGPPSRRRRPALIAAVLTLGVLLLAGVVVWRFWPQPVAPLTLDELKGVYAGMVRSDGTNDASVLQRRNAPPREVAVTPAACAPLFATTAFNQFPDEAVDGVGTYWIGQRLTTSLFTMRFVDASAAAREYRRVEQALEECADREVAVAARRPTTVTLRPTPVTRDSGIGSQSGYAYDAGSSSTFAVHVLQFENTVTWQFRLDSGDATYDPRTAQQLIDALMSQTRSVLDLRT